MAAPPDALRDRLKRSDCPYLYDCEVQVTRDFFTRICNTPAYVNCQNFAKMVGELRRPINWLQKLAIEQDRLVEPDAEIQ